MSRGAFVFCGRQKHPSVARSGYRTHGLQGRPLHTEECFSAINYIRFSCRHQVAGQQGQITPLPHRQGKRTHAPAHTHAHTTALDYVERRLLCFGARGESDPGPTRRTPIPRSAIAIARLARAGRLPDRKRAGLSPCPRLPVCSGLAAL